MNRELSPAIKKTFEVLVTLVVVLQEARPKIIGVLYQSASLVLGKSQPCCEDLQRGSARSATYGRTVEQVKLLAGTMCCCDHPGMETAIVDEV